MDIKLTAKDWDGYVSFLGRLNKLGKGYIMKNGIMKPMILKTRSCSNDRIVGYHYIVDPFYIDDDQLYVVDGIYAEARPIEELLALFKQIKEEVKGARKKIYIVKEKDVMGVQFNDMEFIPIFKLTISNPTGSYYDTSHDLMWYHDYVDPIVYDWNSISVQDLIDLRNNKVKVIKQTMSDGKLGWARIAKSVFPMAGVTKMDVAFAEYVNYTFIPSDQDNIATLRFHVMYRAPGGSKLIHIECIHEYLVLLYNEYEEE